MSVEQTIDQPEQCRFPGAAAPDDADHLSGIDRQVYIVDRLCLTEFLLEGMKFKHRMASACQKRQRRN